MYHVPGYLPTDLPNYFNLYNKLTFINMPLDTYLGTLRKFRENFKFKFKSFQAIQMISKKVRAICIPTLFTTLESRIFHLFHLSTSQYTGASATGAYTAYYCEDYKVRHRSIRSRIHKRTNSESTILTEY
uniref:Uncharacterized protein n=2 Tax=Cacopsylla melanoneura TaxID=428564 RepID=A0A8D8ZD22_9HEMI